MKLYAMIAGLLAMVAGFFRTLKAGSDAQKVRDRAENDKAVRRARDAVADEMQETSGLSDSDIRDRVRSRDDPWRRL